MSFCSLPNEPIIETAKYLGARDLSRLSRKSIHFNALLRSPVLEHVGQADILACVNQNSPDSLRFILRSPIEFDCGVGRTPYFSKSPMVLACACGLTKIVAVFLEHGVPVISPNKKFPATNLQHAVRGGHLDTVTLLLATGTDTNRASILHVKRPLALACWHHREQIAHMLLDHGAREDAVYARESAMVAAAQNGQVRVLERILDSGVDVNRTYRVAQGVDTPVLSITVLQWVCIADQDAPDVVGMEVLLSRGADVNVGHGGDFFPLWRALTSRNVGQVRLLIKYGADVELVYCEISLKDRAEFLLRE